MDGWGNEYGRERFKVVHYLLLYRTPLATRRVSVDLPVLVSLPSEGPLCRDELSSSREFRQLESLVLDSPVKLLARRVHPDIMVA